MGADPPRRYARVLPREVSEHLSDDRTYWVRRDTYGPSRQGYPPERVQAILSDLLAHDKRSDRVQVILGVWEQGKFQPIASTLTWDRADLSAALRDYAAKAKRYRFVLGVEPPPRLPGRRPPRRPQMGIQIVRQRPVRRGERLPARRGPGGRFAPARERTGAR